MELSSETIDGVVVLHPAAGDLTAATSAPLEEAIRTELARGAQRMVIDLSGVRYVASAGLRVFLIAAKRVSAKGHLVLAGANPSVRQVLDVTGFSGIIEVKDTVQKAVASAAA